ncbi:hypothetical protein FM076_15845 [Streptomyces albus subsp. chlorinus]|uniref:hypothetical protein n=1 Tax=Streptomyces albus TaxID=1888 RepID=UPI00156F1049|nr:hypothetical protein [Streptomyces albus]NSC22569.1 hypothetical protein [Streptomyces albus subsp. chlorinus]
MFLGLHGVVDVDAAVIEHWHQDDVAEVDDGINGLVPMEAAVDARAALASMAEWQELTAFRQPERAVRVRLEGLPDSVRADKLAATVEDLAQGHLACRPGAGADANAFIEGVATRPTGHERLQEVPSGDHCLSFDCTVQGWNANTAAWLAELFTEALRQSCAVKASVLVAVGTSNTGTSSVGS